jgi:ATP/maltotriose-dependent transcriptional regulator MalT
VGFRILAQLDALRGDAAAAALALRDAATLLGDADAYERARLDAARARVWRQAGNRADADAARAAACAVFERLGARLDLAALDDERDIR